mgnify:CR=1 FL=1
MRPHVPIDALRQTRGTRLPSWLKVRVPGSGAFGAIREKLRALVARTGFHYEGRDVAVTISLGVATLDAGIADAEAFVKAADERLYQAKSGGRDRVGA